MDDLFNDIIDDSQSLKVGGLCYHFWNIFSKCLLTSFYFEMTPQILINLKSKKHQQYMFRGIIPPCQLLGFQGHGSIFLFLDLVTLGCTSVVLLGRSLITCLLEFEIICVF